MGWLIKERRGPEWKQGWAEKAISAVSPPPAPLLGVLGILLLFLWLSYYADYRAQVQRTVVNSRLLLFLLPVLLIFLMRSIGSLNRERVVLGIPGAGHRDSIHRAGSSPWGMALLVAVLLVMVSYQSSFHNNWFRPLWRHD
ncbi:uncharacterized protein LOC131161422 [Malania oleifera]|uniref:uncharacterized protein LOC131161422 n=1 Tax=Malania oleifera TaxID=397392 RepID=UPI0025ADE06F|nr:uncharacterized protein LOC131161422 [Malania oleifera]